MTSAQTTSNRRELPPLARLVGATAALAAILVVLLGLFILPSLSGGPDHLPVGVVGTEQQVDEIETLLDAAQPDAFTVEQVDDRDALVDAITARELTGGFVLPATDDSNGADEAESAGEPVLESIVASAGSTAISGTISAAGTQVAAAWDLDHAVADVVALPADDPTGVGIGGLAFPLVFGGIVPVVAFRALFPHSRAWRVAGMLSVAVVGGAVVAAVLQFWFGSITDSFVAVTAAMALGISALALPLAGLQHVFGGRGFTIGAMAMMFLGNPLAGIATGAAWLPDAVGILGQALPPGATGSLVRAVAYFDGIGSMIPAVTLACWVVGGAVLLLMPTKAAASTE